jgi:uncharacterized peroxidase-related enzyme
VPFVELVTEEQASHETRSLFEDLRKGFGFLPNYFQAAARSLPFLRVQAPLGDSILADGALTRVQKEQIGLVVSGINTSSYCVALHMENLRNLGIEKHIGRKLATDYANAPVEAKMQTLFLLADRLTGRPADFRPEDAKAVRAAGWSEQALFEAVLTVAYFNLVNRISIGLGLVADF